MGKANNKIQRSKAAFLNLKKKNSISQVWVSGVSIATRFCSDLKHHLRVGKSLQFVKTVVKLKLGNTGSGFSMQFILLQAEKEAH